MSQISIKKITLAAAGSALLALFLAVGCAKNDGSGGSSASQSDATLVAAGKAVFASNNCTRCHSVGGQGGRMGPELTHTAADATHTTQWLTEHVKNPKAHNPSSRMPAYEGRIAEKDLNALGAYLASLR